MIIFELTDALVTTLTDALDCEVYDAYPNTKSVEPMVVVGGSIDNDLTGKAATKWHSVPWDERDEDIQIVVAVLVQNGNSTHSSARARCTEIVADIMRAIKDDPSLGLSEATNADPRVGDVDIEIRQGLGKSAGATWIEAILTIHIQAITSTPL